MYTDHRTNQSPVTRYTAQFSRKFITHTGPVLFMVPISEADDLCHVKINFRDVNSQSSASAVYSRAIIQRSVLRKPRPQLASSDANRKRQGRVLARTFPAAKFIFFPRQYLPEFLPPYEAAAAAAAEIQRCNSERAKPLIYSSTRASRRR